MPAVVVWIIGTADRPRLPDSLKLPYRPEIDGLRAIAVVSILLFHAEIPAFGGPLARGGFLGVDVFFVISGYLITGIVAGELRAGTFSYAQFYERRARRILPALVLVMAACFPAAWLVMTPEQLANLSRSALANAVFAANFFFWSDAGYFSESILLKPLSHTWSLSVEEQFYAVFPAFLVLVFRRRLSVPVTFGAIAVASLALGHALSRSAPEAGFYLLPTRAWEFLAGASLAAMEIRFGRRSTPILDHAAPALGLAILAFAFHRFDGATPHPALPTLAPIAATMALIWFTGRRDAVTALLSSRPFVGIGLVSYSLYLWHQPLFAFARLHAIDRPATAGYLALMALAVALAWLSWRFVEQPFRDKARLSRRAVWTASGAGLAAIAAAGAVGVAGGGFPARMPEVEGLRSLAEGYRTKAGDLCTRDNCRVGDAAAAPSIVLVGDSHAGALARSLEKALEGSGRSALVLANGDMFVDRYPPFYATGERYQPVLESQKPVVWAAATRTVILAARYTLRVENAPFDNGEGGVEFLPGTYAGHDEGQRREVLAAIDRATRDLLARGKRVVLVYPVPEVGWDVPVTLQKLAMRGDRSPLTTSHAAYRARNERVTRLFDAIPDSPLLIRVRPDRIFCDTFVAGRCATHAGPDIFYFDDDHLSVSGADRLVAEIARLAKERWGGLD